MDQWTIEIIPQLDAFLFTLYTFEVLKISIPWNSCRLAQYAALNGVSDYTCKTTEAECIIRHLVQYKTSQKSQMHMSTTQLFLFEGERWRQELLHLHTLYQCLCTCSGILHRFDYITPAFFLKSLVWKRWQWLLKPTAGFISIADAAVKSNNKPNEKQDAQNTTIDPLSIHEMFSTSKVSQWWTVVGTKLIGQMSTNKTNT